MLRKCIWKQLLQFHCIKDIFIILDDGRFSLVTYTALTVYDYYKVVQELSYCLSLCSINTTCAAVQYDRNTTICYFSSRPFFLNFSHLESAAYHKRAHVDGLSVAQFQNNMALGEFFLCNVSFYGKFTKT